LSNCQKGNWRVLSIAKKGTGEFCQLSKRELASFVNCQFPFWQVLASFGKFWQINLLI